MPSQALLNRLSTFLCILHLSLAQPTTTAAFDANQAACTSYSSILSSCAAATTSFAALPFVAEASCLCYTGSSPATWAPSFYDGMYASCINYYQTASPSVYSASFTGQAAARTPCAQAGNVIGGAASTGVASLNVESSSPSATAGSAASTAAASSASTTSASSGAAAAAAAAVVGGRGVAFVAACAAVVGVCL